MVGLGHQTAIVPFPLFHGTSTVFVPSIRAHGLGGKNIVADWRILDFLRAGMAILDSHIDQSDPDIRLQWRVLLAAASQRVDHWNWRHGATYLTADKFKAIAYANSSPYRSELLGFAGWLLEHCPPVCTPILDATMANYSELSECLRLPHEPLLICATGVPMSFLLTEKGEDATDIVRELTAALAKSERFFNAFSQLGHLNCASHCQLTSCSFFVS